MLNIAVAVLLTYVLVWFIPSALDGANTSNATEMHLAFGAIVAILLWCGLSLAEIAKLMRAARAQAAESE